MMAFAFRPGMGFERYVDYALDVPMYFVKRGERYHDVSGRASATSWRGGSTRCRASARPCRTGRTTCRPSSRGAAEALPSRCAGEDVGSAEMIVALGALFVGLLYDRDALQAASDLVAPWTDEMRQAMRDAVPTQGFRTEIGGRTLRDVARDMLALSRGGLERRGFRDGQGRDEAQYLAPLDDLVARARRGRTCCWSAITAPGMAASTRPSSNAPIDAGSRGPRRFAGHGAELHRRQFSVALGFPPSLRAQRSDPGTVECCTRRMFSRSDLSGKRQRGCFAPLAMTVEGPILAPVGRSSAAHFAPGWRPRGRCRAPWRRRGWR